MTAQLDAAQQAALDAYADGLTVAEVAEAHGLHRNTVGRWVLAAGIGRPNGRMLGSADVYRGGWVQDGYIMRPAVKSR